MKIPLRWPRLDLEVEELDEGLWWWQNTLVAIVVCPRCGCWAPAVFVNSRTLTCTEHWFPYRGTLPSYVLRHVPHRVV